MTLPDAGPPRLDLPAGFRDLLFERAAALEAVERAVLATFAAWGFRRVVTPTVEYLDVLETGVGDDLPQRAFRSTDQPSGRVVLLRPDVTAQVARLVASRLRTAPLPLRLCYNLPVVRNVEPTPGRPREIFQAGVELIGLDLPEADAEMLAIAAHALRAAGLARFTLDVGQAEFYRGLAERVPPGPGRRALEAAIARKDRSAVEAALAALPLPAADAERLAGLIDCFGGEEVLERAERLAAGGPERAQRALATLRAVIQVVKGYGLGDVLSIDLAELRGLGYYTGVTFEAYAAGVGRELAGGGRYDELIGRYGYPCPATGFMIDLEGVLTALERQGRAPEPPGTDILLMDIRPDKGEALAVAQALRGRGFTVARDIIRRDYAGSLAYARHHGIRWVLLLGETPGAARLERVRDGLVATLPVGALLEAREPLVVAGAPLEPGRA
ncbi:MAG TPA: ATP phosphoribosyltransferase regulatory subunit [Thermodesulfobacteriota bacterium]|nr:ATP phosphoribosyltransferase regulatory subunit [Thermodesulfobacteriota bacterium]